MDAGSCQSIPHPSEILNRVQQKKGTPVGVPFFMVEALAEKPPNTINLLPSSLPHAP